MRWATMAAPAGLDLLPLGPGADPDIFADSGSVTYTAASDSLVITLNPQTIFSAGTSYAITSGATGFTLNATIDDVTGVMTSGSFKILGSVAGLFDPGTEVLTGTLTSFGFGGAGSVLEWEFLATGGNAQALLETGGIILGGSNFPGVWTGDFSASFTATADVGLVPEPSTALLLGLGLMGLGLRGRRQA